MHICRRLLVSGMSPIRWHILGPSAKIPLLHGAKLQVQWTGIIHHEMSNRGRRAARHYMMQADNAARYLYKNHHSGIIRPVCTIGTARAQG
ncbi:hypothetical protein CENSYa_0680 [Cenarchaeum symbiosum A]|uniref:Uncharacterized protein n=1 Tax=Cenarchaeum symbiosum (strain A) TaxID=414004 RepID=A0RVE6_CENSY|nr:hypothetical protein CENSYa_0680 [Cenarchaeum symbiosum A]